MFWYSLLEKDQLMTRVWLVSFVLFVTAQRQDTIPPGRGSSLERWTAGKAVASKGCRERFYIIRWADSVFVLEFAAEVGQVIVAGHDGGLGNRIQI